jgi:hypothetical protein
MVETWKETFSLLQEEEHVEETVSIASLLLQKIKPANLNSSTADS